MEIEELALRFLPWLPFSLCALAAVREWEGGGRDWRPPLWLWGFLILPPCLSLGLHNLLEGAPAAPAALLVLMLLWGPVLAWRAAIPMGYASYSLLPGIFTCLLLTLLGMDGRPALFFRHPWWSVILLLAASGFCGWACLVCLRRWVFPCRSQIAAAKGLLFDAPVLVHLGLLLFFHYGDAIYGGSQYGEAMKLICFCFCFASLWDSYRRNSRLLMTTRESVSQQNRAEFLAHSLQLQQDRYDTLVEQVQVTRALRHDLRHHEMMINQYLCGGDREGLAAYAQEFRRQQDQLRQEPSVCANPVVDALARYYLGQMEKVGTTLDVVLQISEQCPIPGADLCVVLSNCLENALEAIRQAAPAQRYFRMRAVQDDSMLTIVAENGYSGERLRDNSGFLSTKRTGRGVGLDSMASIAKKYHGDFRARADNGAFRVSVALFGQEESQ